MIHILSNDLQQVLDLAGGTGDLAGEFAKLVGKQGLVVLADINVGVLYLFAISSLGVYGIIMAGWASNSMYPFLGALRSAAQMVSYEVSIGFVIITVLLCVGSLNLSDVVEAQRGLWFCIPLLPMFIIFQRPLQRDSLQFQLLNHLKLLPLL